MTFAGPYQYRPPRAGDLDRARVAVVGYRLDPGNGAIFEKGEHRGPVIGRPVAQKDLHLAVRPRCLRRGVTMAQSARRAAIELPEGLVEAPNAAKPPRQGDLGHGRVGYVDT